jgi:hypothetical protein
MAMKKCVTLGGENGYNFVQFHCLALTESSVKLGRCYFEISLSGMIRFLRGLIFSTYDQASHGTFIVHHILLDLLLSPNSHLESIPWALAQVLPSHMLNN